MAMGSVTPPLPAATLSGRNPDVKLLPDVYHMYRGGSGSDTPGLLNGTVIDLVLVDAVIATSSA